MNKKSKRSKPQPRCKLFSERLKEVLNLVEKEKSGNKKYSREDVSETTGINKQTLTHYTKGQGFPRIDELKTIVEYCQSYIPDFNTDYLLGISENKTLISRSANDMFGFDDDTTHILLGYKHKINAFSMLIKASHFILFIDALDNVLLNKTIPLSYIKDNQKLESLDVKIYEDWLLETEMRKCIHEITENPVTDFNNKFYTEQQKTHQTKMEEINKSINEALNDLLIENKDEE